MDVHLQPLDAQCVTVFCDTFGGSNSRDARGQVRPRPVCRPAGRLTSWTLWTNLEGLHKLGGGRTEPALTEGSLRPQI